MSYANAKGETLRAWGNQTKGKRDPDSDKCQRTGSASSADGLKSLGINRTDWQRADSSSRWTGGLVAGGIIVQLIDETNQELAECEAKRQTLSDRLQLLKLLLGRLEDTQ